MEEFPEGVIEQAWERADRRCECTRTTHDHSWSRCNRLLLWFNRGKEAWGSWETHCKNRLIDKVPSNCEILCWECYRLTLQLK